jgi:hypothetical protein
MASMTSNKLDLNKANCFVIIRLSVTILFISPLCASGSQIQTLELGIMSQLFYHCATTISLVPDWNN